MKAARHLKPNTVKGLCCVVGSMQLRNCLDARAVNIICKVFFYGHLDIKQFFPCGADLNYSMALWRPSSFASHL